jgi:hypothetical protein
MMVEAGKTIPEKGTTAYFCGWKACMNQQVRDISHHTL